MKLLLTLIFSMLLAAEPAGAGESSLPSGITVEEMEYTGDLEDAIDSALWHIRKALDTQSLGDLRYHAGKAGKYARDAKAVAGDLGFDEIQGLCAEGYKYIGYALEEDSFSEAAVHLQSAQKELLRAYRCLW